ncbi:MULTISPECIES: hypothetical protein [Sphingobacterium]|uniref:hypothetical protein n=1 Tax=Sphingobacterium TaxID=28453 RepID=UPI00257C5539|nr:MULTISPECIES: hypothetical protein [Sphingobacterium]
MKKIFELAKKAGACKDRGLDVIANSKSVVDLIKLMISPQGIEFCMENRFPSLEVMQHHRDELTSHAVYIDGAHTVTGSGKILVFGGQVDIKAGSFDVVEIFATNDAFVNVVARDNAFVSVELHHSARMNFEKYGLAKIKEFKK